jgi:hypothetical protein
MKLLSVLFVILLSLTPVACQAQRQGTVRSQGSTQQARAPLSFAARTQIATLDTGQGNFFDSQTYDPSVLMNPDDPALLIMFFSGMAAPVQLGAQSIGRATAKVSDPTTWEVSNSGNPILAANGNGWESGGDGLRCDSVLYNAGDHKLYLYYTAHASQIGLATSSDLGLTWTKHASNPILSPSGNETHNSQFAVIKEGSTWRAYYSYRTAGAILPAYRYATSRDGVSWTKSVGDIYSDGGRYMEFHQIFKIGDRYYLAYESGGNDMDWDIRIATSTDPATGWTRSATNPFFVKSGTVGAFDRYLVATPCFIKIKGVWWLFYCGAKDHAQPYGTNHWPMGAAFQVVPSP